MDGASRPAVIIDNGSGYTKMGFAGNLEPSFVVPTAVALNESFAAASAVGSLSPAQLRSAGVMTDLDFFIGHDAIAAARTGNYTLTYPIRRGRVVNWDSMERLWQHCLFNFLRVDPEDHMLMLTESPLTPPEHREYTAEIMFETFNVAGLYIGGQPMLSLMAANAAAQTPLTGVVVDVGDGSTSVVPVAEGYVIGGSIRSMPIGGSHVTAFVQQLMRERGEAVPPEEAMEVARRVKEAYGYTCADIVKEFGKHDREPAKFRKVYRGTNSRTGAPFQCDVGHERFLAAEVFFSPDMLGSIAGASSSAAGGKSSGVGDGYGMGAPSPASVSGSGEALPSLPELVDLAIQSAPIDTRRALYKTIVLAGGSSQFKDFGRRLQRDVKRLVDVRQGRASSAPLTSAGSPAPPEQDASGAGSVEVAVVSHHMQSHAAWFGGSVVGATPAFPSLCHTRAQYEEYGAGICRTTAIVKGM